MQLGMIGLGRMGANLVRRCSASGIECVVNDHGQAPIDALVARGRDRRVDPGGARRPARRAARGLVDGARGRDRAR